MPIRHPGSRLRAAVFCLIGLMGLAAGCAPVSSTPTLSPTPQPLLIYLDPYLEPIQPLLANCAGKNTALYYTPLDSNPDAVIQWGPGPISNRSLWAIGSESLVAAVHPSRNMGNMALGNLQRVYQGKVSDWSQLGQPAAPLHAWSYSTDTRIAKLFAEIGPGGGNAPTLQFAPGPSELRQAVAQDPDGLGLLPSRWIDTSVKAVALEPVGADALSQPILAGTQGPPQGVLKDWLVCVQNQLKEQ